MIFFKSVAKDPVITGLVLGAATGGLAAGAGASLFNATVAGGAIGAGAGAAVKSTLTKTPEGVPVPTRGDATSSPAPSRGESAATVSGRLASEERRRRRQRLAAGNLGSPNLGFTGLLGL